MFSSVKSITFHHCMITNFRQMNSRLLLFLNFKLIIYLCFISIIQLWSQESFYEKYQFASDLDKENTEGVLLINDTLRLITEISGSTLGY